MPEMTTHVFQAQLKIHEISNYYAPFILSPFPWCCPTVRATHYWLTSWVKLLDTEVLQE